MLGSLPDDPRSGLVYIFPARGLFLRGFFRLFSLLWHSLYFTRRLSFPSRPNC